MLALLALAAPLVVLAHNPLAVPYEAVPGYTDCSQMDARAGGRAALRYNAARPCAVPAPAPGSTTISCVGDSITAGGWPQIMQANLNAKYGAGRYNVINFGECGSTMQVHADSPYVNRSSWPKVLNTSSDVIIVMLGTNDSKTRANGGAANWEDDGRTGQAEYTADYATMIKTFLALPSKPDVYTTVPVPNYKNGVYGMNQTVINTLFPILLPQIVRGGHCAIDTPLGAGACSRPPHTP